MITLTNRRCRMLAFNLTEKDGRPLEGTGRPINVARTVTTRRGEIRPKRMRIMAPRVLTFQSRGTRGASIIDLDDKVLTCPEIAGALSRGDLKLMKQKPKAARPKAPVKESSTGANTGGNAPSAGDSDGSKKTSSKKTSSSEKGK